MYDPLQVHTNYPPQALALVSLIPKADGLRPKDLRPISVMSVMASSRALGLAERESSVRSGGARAAAFVTSSAVISNIVRTLLDGSTPARPVALVACETRWLLDQSR